METEKDFNNHSHRKPAYGIGVILMLVGALFLAFNFGVLEGGFKRVIFSWQMLLIVIGIVEIFKRKVFSGLILMSIGSFFMIPRLFTICPETFYWASGNFVHTYWPILLILAGVLLIFQKLFFPKTRCSNDCASISKHYHHQHRHSRRGNVRSGFDRNAVFGNIEEIILDPEFTGGEVNAVFGGVTLDLRKTNLPEGETELEVNAVFGGVKVYVPEDWYVELHLTTIFGGFQDYRVITNNNLDRSKKLIVIGACVFGGGEIRN